MGNSFKSRTFLFLQHTTINQIANMMSFELFTLLKECTETIKNSEHHQLKINRSYCIVSL